MRIINLNLISCNGNLFFIWWLYIWRSDFIFTVVTVYLTIAIVSHNSDLISHNVTLYHVKANVFSIIMTWSYSVIFFCNFISHFLIIDNYFFTLSHCLHYLRINRNLISHNCNFFYNWLYSLQSSDFILTIVILLIFFF